MTRPRLPRPRFCVVLPTRNKQDTRNNVSLLLLTCTNPQPNDRSLIPENDRSVLRQPHALCGGLFPLLLFCRVREIPDPFGSVSMCFFWLRADPLPRYPDGATVCSARGSQRAVTERTKNKSCTLTSQYHLDRNLLCSI